MGAKERMIWGGVALLAFLAGFFLRSGRDEPAEASGRQSAGSGAPESTTGTSREVVTVTSAKPVVFGPVPESRSADDMAAFAVETLETPNRVERFAALSNLLENLTADNWRQVKLAFIDQTTNKGRLQYQEWTLFLQQAGEAVGRPFIDSLYEWNGPNDMRYALTGWAISEPEAAVDWLETVPDPEYRDKIWGAAVRGVAVTDPDLSIRLLEELEVSERAQYTGDLMSTIVQTVGVEEASRVFDRAIERAAEKGELEGDYLEKIFSTLVERRVRSAKNVGGVEAWARKHLGQPYVMNGFYFKTAETLAREDPGLAMTWLEDAAEAGFDRGGHGAIITGWVESRGGEAVEEWLNANPDNPHRDFLAAKYAKKIVAEKPAAAAAWIETIRNPEALEEAPTWVREALSDPFGAPNFEEPR